jgi:hypothetical protein
VGAAEDGYDRVIGLEADPALRRLLQEQSDG